MCHKPSGDQKTAESARRVAAATNRPKDQETEDTAAVLLESAEDSATFASMAATTLIQAELPPELTDRARSFVEEGWATDMNELLAEALRRFLESHSGDLTEAMIQEDVNWGLHGKD